MPFLSQMVGVDGDTGLPPMRSLPPGQRFPDHNNNCEADNYRAAQHAILRYPTKDYGKWEHHDEDHDEDQ